MSADRPAKSPASADRPLITHIISDDVYLRFAPMLRELLPQLAEEEFRILTVTDSLRICDALTPLGVECRMATALSGWRAWRLAAELRQIFATRPALIHIWGCEGLPRLTRFANDARIPVLLHVLGDDDLAAVQRLRDTRERHYAGACTTFCTVLGSAGNLTHYPVRPLRPAVPETGIPDHHHVTPSTRGALWVGRFDDAAGLETALDAVAEVRQRQLKFQFALLGEGPALHDVWRSARERSVQDLVTLIESPDLWEVALAGADVLIIPGRQDRLTIIPLIAMAMGKLVFASDDQTADWFVHDQTSWLFTPGTAHELASLFARAEENPDRAATLLERAREYVQRNHGMEQLVTSLSEFYQTIAYPQRTLQLPDSDARN
jgi:glycosyltransferase involved in cell wall biosynthesis